MNTRSKLVYAGWARQLEMRGLSQPAGFLLQIFAPLSFFVSQVYLLGQPWIKPLLPADQQQALVELLDSQSNYQMFTLLLLHPEDQIHG